MALGMVDAASLSRSPIAEQMAIDLKFADCIPAEIALDIADARLGDEPSLRACLDEPRRGWNDRPARADG